MKGTHAVVVQRKVARVSTLNLALMDYRFVSRCSLEVVTVEHSISPFSECLFFLPSFHRWPSLIPQVSRDYYKQTPLEKQIPTKDLGDNTECKTDFNK